jgi:hypothetical protein
MSRDVSLSDAHSLSLGQANFRTRYGSIGAVDGQDARMLRAHGRVRATAGQDARMLRTHGRVRATAGQDARMSRSHGCDGATLTGGCVGLMIRRAPARVAGQ